MARPYKGYRAAREALGGDTTKSQAAHRAGRFDVDRKPLIVASAAIVDLTAEVSAAASVPNGDTVTVVIAFGEGAPVAGGAAVLHDYLTPGAKQIVVTATASNGQVATKTLDVVAAEPEGG